MASHVPSTTRRTPPYLLYSAVSALLMSFLTTVTAQAPAAAPSLAPVEATAGECSSVLLAIGSYDAISWIEPPVSGEGVSIMNLTLCGTAAAPTATLSTELLIGVEDAGSNPSYCDQFDATTIICGNEVDEGSVSMLDLSSAVPPKLFELNTSGAVHIELLSSGAVATASYGGSSFTTFDPAQDPSSAVIQTVEIPLENATMALGDEGRQEAPHPHMVTEVAEGELLVVDLGSDAVYQYGVSADGMLTWQGDTSLTPGDGPRHAAVGKMGKVYVVAELALKILELDSTCDIGAVGAARGVCFETVIPVPEDGTVYSSAAAVRVSKDQEFVYVSMRREEDAEDLGAIVGYNVQANGSVGELVGAWESGGQQPRDFALVDVPGFKEVVVVANRKSNSIDVLDRDVTTGEVGETLVTAAVNSPTSVLVLANVSAADLDPSSFLPVVSNVAAAAPTAAAPTATTPGLVSDSGVDDSAAGASDLDSGGDESMASEEPLAGVDTSASAKATHEVANALLFTLSLGAAGCFMVFDAM